MSVHQSGFLFAEMNVIVLPAGKQIVVNSHPENNRRKNAPRGEQHDECLVHDGNPPFIRNVSLLACRRNTSERTLHARRTCVRTAVLDDWRKQRGRTDCSLWCGRQRDTSIRESALAVRYAAKGKVTHSPARHAATPKQPRSAYGRHRMRNCAYSAPERQHQNLTEAERRRHERRSGCDQREAIHGREAVTPARDYATLRSKESRRRSADRAASDARIGSHV
jgi:hypothetical protein